jgi:23S rRNA (guanosine2251-2'-O)-methyltransferase
MSIIKKKEKFTELIFGIHPILQLLKVKKRPLGIIYTTKPTPKAWKLIEPLLPRGIQVQFVPRAALTTMAGTTDHQSIVAYTTPFFFKKTFFDPKKDSTIVLLDSIQDTRNLGAILRSAYCTNVDGIILTQKNSAPLGAAALKASAGLAEHLAIYVVPTAAAAMILIKKAGYTPYLSLIDGKEHANAIRYDQASCIVIGSEDTGISNDIRSTGITITLPQKSKNDSYNASVAAGILFFLVATQKSRI